MIRLAWQRSSRSQTFFADGMSVAPDRDAELPSKRIASFVVPGCAVCEGTLKPNVVFFGHNVARPLVDRAFAAVDAAEVLLVLGTSLAVFSGYRFLLRAAERGLSIVT
jgi:NAD+-dependent protein deacetylase sirtuin 4